MLTAIGVALGAATVVGVGDVNESILASFDQMIETVAGAGELEVSAPTGGVGEEKIALLSALPEVRAAAGVVEGFVPLRDRPGEAFYILGVDFLGSRLWASQIPRSAIDMPDELVFVARSDSVMVTRQFAERFAVHQEDEVAVIGPGGARSLRVRAFLENVPAARLFDGMIAIMDLPAAQKLLGRERHVDRIAVQLSPPANVRGVRELLETRLGPGFDIGPPESRGAQSERLLLSLRSMLVVASSLAVIVGILIVYQTVALSVQQRRRQFALLNTVGVKRFILVRLCLAEILVLATIGGVAGIAGGWLLGILATGVVGATASEIWVRLAVTRLEHSVIGSLAGFSVGVGTALVAAYLAANATFRAPSVEALRAVETEPEGNNRLLRSVVLASLLLGGTWSIALAPPGLGFVPIVVLVIMGQAAAYLASMFVGPVLIAALQRPAARLARATRSVSIRLAAGNVPRVPGRSGATVAMIGAALGLTVTMFGLVQSFESAWLAWITEHFDADLFVGAGDRFRLLAGPPMSKDVGTAVAGLPGVATVEPFRVVPLEIEGRPIFLQAISVDRRLEHGGLAMVEGDLREAMPSLRDGRGVLLSDNLAIRLGLHPGQEIVLPTPRGNRPFHIEGTFVDYIGSLDLGAVATDVAVLEEVWNDTQANLYRVWLAPGYSATSVRSIIVEHLGAGYYVLTAGQFLDGVRAVLDRFFVATWALELIAALIGVMGVINAQLATVVDRGTEIAMIRTIGVRARDVTRAVLLECGVIGAVGGLVGLLLGMMLGAQFVWISLHLITGWRIPFRLPIGPVMGCVAVASILSAIAGYVPAAAAARLEPRQRSVE